MKTNAYIQRTEEKKRNVIGMTILILQEWEKYGFWNIYWTFPFFFKTLAYRKNRDDR